MKKVKSLWPYPQKINVSGKFNYPDKIKITGYKIQKHLVRDILDIGCFKLSDKKNAYVLEFKIDKSIKNEQEYYLNISPLKTVISAFSGQGVSYGIQALLQIFALYRKAGELPSLSIRDWPAYRNRSFMIDMGRSTYTLPMIKRVIRILSRLKMNQLHLHLFDDELCGIRFNGLPYGEENPYSISISDLQSLVKYAALYNIEVIPELEAWGHAGSIVYHSPELRGGRGMYNRGSSFLICEETFLLIKNMVEQIVKVMPDNCKIHLGLDEAVWFLSKKMPAKFTPSDMITRYYNILQELGKKYNKKITLMVWADHGGRPVPEEIRKEIIIMPWNYWNANRKDIDARIKEYSGKEKSAWMPGAGCSCAQFRASYHATRYWAKKCINSPNIYGIDITFWGTNDLENKLIGLFAGSYYLWNPSVKNEFSDVEDYEEFDSKVFPAMCWWQDKFRDAYPDDIIKDRGPFVYMGFYRWGKKHLRPVAPTAPSRLTIDGHDYLNE